jgi:hypothetical protein
VRVARTFALAGVLCVTGCGSESSTVRGKDSTARTLAALAERAGDVVAVMPGAADFEPGPVRYTFLVIAKDGRPIERPRATVWLSRSRERAPFQRTTATLEHIGLPDTARTPFVHALYVAHLDVPGPGTYWLLARPNGARIAALGNVVVKPATDSPAVGARAPRSETPTLATTAGRIAPLSTAPKPDRELYRFSVASSLRDRVPFVVTFATPAFCTSRTCGPVVDVVSRVRSTVAGASVRFIHVEVYRDNNPSLGYNPWMKQWDLTTEPWVFLVGADGRIKEKFEGSVSVRELRTAVQRRLMR